MVAPKPIVQLHPTTHAVIRVWDSARVAARRLRIGRKLCGGFKWRCASKAEARFAVDDAEPTAEELAIVTAHRFWARPKPVVQLDMRTGEVVKGWPTACAAARFLRVQHGHISECCRGGRNCAYGYCWRWATQDETEELSIAKEYPCGRGPKPVSQLDMRTGKTVKVWPTASAAARFLRVQHGRLGECCRGERASAYGYCWRWVTQDDAIAADTRKPKRGNERATNDAEPACASGVIPCAKPVLQMDASTGALIRKWPSVASAAGHVSRSPCAISKAATGINPTAAGFRWRFSDESGTCYGSKRKAAPAGAARDNKRAAPVVVIKAEPETLTSDERDERARLLVNELVRHDDARLAPPSLVTALAALGSELTAAAIAVVCAELVAALDGEEQAPASLTMVDQVYDNGANPSASSSSPQSGFKERLKNTARDRPTAIVVQPNQLAGARIVETRGPLFGQFEAFARHDIEVGALIPYAGTVRESGRAGYMFELSDRGLFLDPDPRCVDSILDRHSTHRLIPRRCVATFVNDAFGPDRVSHPGQRQNVEFVCLKDGSGFPHIFWRCIRAIPKGGTLWGDYGHDFWEDKQDDDPIFTAMLRRMLYMVRGCSAAFPVPQEVGA